MYPAKFDYYRANNVQEAVSLLQQHGEEAKLLAGGHSLIPMMKLRLAQPPVLIDIGRIDELQRIETLPGGGVRIGAMVTYTEIARNNDVRNNLEALAEACANIGDVQVRNRGTIGGNLAHNDPASDLPAVALALEARLHCAGPGGSRTVAADDFIVDLFETALQPGEVVTSVEFDPVDGGSAYVKFENPASGYAICGIAAVISLADDGTISKCRLAVTGATSHASRLRVVEDALEGQVPDQARIATAAASAADGFLFNSDIHGSEAYRAHLTRVLTRRAIETALERAR